MLTVHFLWATLLSFSHSPKIPKWTLPLRFPD
jgi:hypothetical protein